MRGVKDNVPGIGAPSVVIVMEDELVVPAKDVLVSVNVYTARLLNRLADKTRGDVTVTGLTEVPWRFVPDIWDNEAAARSRERSVVLQTKLALDCKVIFAGTTREPAGLKALAVLTEPMTMLGAPTGRVNIAAVAELLRVSEVTVKVTSDVVLIEADPANNE